MYCTWKNSKCRKSKTIISTLKNRPLSVDSIMTLAFQLNSNVGIVLLNKFNSNREQDEFISRLNCSRKFDRKKQP